MGGGLATGAALVGAANFFGFAVTVLTNTHFLTDLLGTGAFAVAAIASVVISGGGGDRALISGACVALWSFRLAGFLLMRILSTKTDARLSDAFATTGKTAVFWSLSGLWGFITLLPHSLLTGQATPVPLGPVGYCATAMFVLGWLFESVADAQKWNWKQTAEAKTTFCDTGLWKLSRHPNYFGEITVWVSLFLLAAPGLASAGGGAIAFANWKVCLAALSPAFVSFLLLKVSGVPLAEKRYDERFGTSEPYLAYKARTPLLIPRLPFTSRK